MKYNEENFENIKIHNENKKNYKKKNRLFT